jgi:hypothetical protein
MLQTVFPKAAILRTCGTYQGIGCKMSDDKKMSKRVAV